MTTISAFRRCQGHNKMSRTPDGRACEEETRTVHEHDRNSVTSGNGEVSGRKLEALRSSSPYGKEGGHEHHGEE